MYGFPMELDEIEVDPSDPRPKWEQVSSAIKAAIKSQKLASGSQLPGTETLRRHFGVSRATVTKAIEALKSDGIVQSRQGSGIWVREVMTRTTELRPVIESHFDSEADFRLDFWGFSSETLLGAMSEPLDRLRSGRFEINSIRLRLVLPNVDRPWTTPAAADGTDHAVIRKRMAQIATRAVDGLKNSVNELQELGFLNEAEVDVRYWGGPPTSKIILINNDAFISWYAHVPRQIAVGDQTIDAVDLMGKDSAVVHISAEASDVERAMIDAARQAFESVWAVAS